MPSIKELKKEKGPISKPANAISGRSAGGNDEETLAAAKNSNLFLNTYRKSKL